MQATLELFMKKSIKQPKTHIFLENEGFLGQMVAFKNILL